MNIKSSYNFPEAKLGPVFAQDKLKEFKALIDTGVSFVTISMPGVGVSYFLKCLACQDFAFFIYNDLYSLPTLNQHEFYRMFLRDLKGNPDGKSDEQVFLETKEIVKNLVAKFEKVVIIFSRFDQLAKEFDANFLSNLQALTTIQPGKIVLIFTSIKPLHDLAPEAVTGGNLTFYSKYLYFKPYSANDLKKLLKTNPQPISSNQNLNELIELSGGHNQLFHILLSSPKQNLLLDRFVKMQMKEFVDYLDYHQRKTLQKIALVKKVVEVDEYLLGVGMIRRMGSGYELFTPLLGEYIKTNMPVKLPVKEAKLFKLLKANMGSTVSKDEIFTEVWPARNASHSDAGGVGHEEGATDWALDALIYRLRKHPFIKANNYIIESHKKVGYTLIQP